MQKEDNKNIRSFVARALNEKYRHNLNNLSQMPDYKIIYTVSQGQDTYCAVNIKEEQEKKVYNSIFGFDEDGEKFFEQDVYEPMSKDNMIDLTNYVSHGFSDDEMSFDR